MERPLVCDRRLAMSTCSSAGNEMGPRDDEVAAAGAGAVRVADRGGKSNNLSRLLKFARKHRELAAICTARAPESRKKWRRRRRRRRLEEDGEEDEVEEALTNCRLASGATTNHLAQGSWRRIRPIVGGRDERDCDGERKAFVRRRRRRRRVASPLARLIISCLPLVFLLLAPSLARHRHLRAAALVIDAGGEDADADRTQMIHVKVGALLEESDHEQANMFIRTIKMINERRDGTIRQLLNISANQAAAIRHRQRHQLHNNRQWLWADGPTKADGLGGALPETGLQNEPYLRSVSQQQQQLANSYQMSVANYSVLVSGGGSSGTNDAPGSGESTTVTSSTNSNNNNNIGSIVSSQSGLKAPSAANGLPPPYESEISREQQQEEWRRKQAPVVAVVKLEPMIEFLSDRQSSFEADGKVCQLIESGVQAVVGPTDGASIQHVQSICDNMEIPYFELRPFLGSPSLASQAAAAAASNQHVFGGRQPPAGQDANGAADISNLATGPKLNGSTSTPPTDQQATQTMQREQQQSAAASNRLEELTLNLYPPTHLLTSAYIDLIYAWNWTSFAVVYEDGNSMIKLQDIFRESSGTWTSKWKIKLFQFNPEQQAFRSASAPASSHGGRPLAPPPGFGDASSASVRRSSHQAGKGEQVAAGVDGDEQHHSSSHNQSARHAASASARDQLAAGRLGFGNKKSRRPTFRDIFWSIRLSGEQNILLDVSTEHLYEALKQAQQVGCMTERYSYLVTSLDLHTLDLEDFKYSRTRITAFSILQVAKSNKLHQQQQQQHLNNHSSSSSGTAGDQQRPDDDDNPMPSFDERYLEQLGVHSIVSSLPPASQQEHSTRSVSSAGATNGAGKLNGAATGTDYGQQRPRMLPGKYKLSPSVVLDKTGAGFMEPPSEIFRQEWSRRSEQLQSSPSSMSLLPSVDRDNELKLFDFLLEQQETEVARVRLSTSAAILHDSLILYMLGLNELDPSGQLLLEANHQPQTIGCSLDSQPLMHGSSLVNYMRRTSFTGLTGPISFDQRGLRTDIRLDLLGMAPDVGMVKVGEWRSERRHAAAATTTPAAAEASATPAIMSHEEQSSAHGRLLQTYKSLLADGARVSVPYTKRVARNGALQVNEIIYERLYREQSAQVDTLIVATKLSQPYFMLKETPNKLVGNDQYEGFAVDLIHELSKLVNFQYKWQEVADKKYGSTEMSPNGTLRWNGIIGAIVYGQADLGIVDLTITAQREEAVDFTLPFMNTGISILFKKPTTKVTTLFSFLSPFSSDVWAYVLAAYCGISSILFLVGHLSPYEWADPHPCQHSSADEQTVVLKNQFSLLNSFWFTIGSLMQQGSDLTPRSMSTRTIAGIWYFFTLIMISSYTANLAAFLTVEKVVYPIENVRDLSQQQEIRYGCVESGSTCTFFHDSQIDTYKRINETMDKFKTYVRSNDEGQKRVEEGKFAFFMESTSIEYIAERNCNLTQIGGLLDSKGYGIATSKRSRLRRPYRTLLSEGILHLQETGMLHVLKNRWWKERRGGGTCTDDGKGGGVTELSLANVGGVFVVLLGGLGISFLVAIAEFMWRAKRSGSSRDRMCEEMINDLKFALACKKSMKPVTTTKRNKQWLASAAHRSEQQQQQSINANGITFAGFMANAAKNKRLKRKDSGDLVGSMAQQQRQRQSAGCGQNALDPSSLNAGEGGTARLVAAPQQQQFSKDCDPTLLHAMLTMLMQQQQQQHPQSQHLHQYHFQQHQQHAQAEQQQQQQEQPLPYHYQVSGGGMSASLDGGSTCKQQVAAGSGHLVHYYSEQRDRELNNGGFPEKITDSRQAGPGQTTTAAADETTTGTGTDELHWTPDVNNINANNDNNMFGRLTFNRANSIGPQQQAAAGGGFNDNAEAARRRPFRWLSETRASGANSSASATSANHLAAPSRSAASKRRLLFAQQTIDSVGAGDGDADFLGH